MADTKISGLTADATPTSDDLIVTVHDPGGTPANRKVTIANLNAALDHGALAGKSDDDHTQYLLADGTRNLTGNLAVSAGATIDGVDISAAFPASSTDNAVVRFDGTSGEALQDSGVTVADVSGSSVTVASTAGNALVVEVTEPAAAAGASVAGKALTLNAGDAVASTDTAGAAAGGSVTIAAGDAKRLTSGNADGGDVILDTGTGIGTGTAGSVIVPSSASGSAPSLQANGVTDGGIGLSNQTVSLFTHSNGSGFSLTNASGFFASVATGPRLANAAASSTAPTVIPNRSDADTGAGSAGADQLSLIAGGTEGARVEATKTTFFGRILGTQGADVASANDITLGNGNYFDITGTTQINTIAATNWTAGSSVVLQFDASVTVKHATAGTGAQLALAGAADFSATAGDTLMLIYDGTVWREVSRTAI